MRSAMALLVLVPTLASGQAPQGEDESKVSNDQPGRPLQMAPASTEVKEAFDDFERFRRRSAWERALKSLYTIPEEQAARFVDGESGFIIPVPRKRRTVLSALPPEGQSAYRLFYDAEAQKLFEEAEGPAELKNLERVYSAYFISSVGDNAGDRLGDLYYELGRFDRAADCWLAVLRERPDTDLSPALLALKAALALSRAGRTSEFEQLRAELTGRYADEKVTLGGRTGAPAALLRDLVGEGIARAAAKASAGAGDAGPELAGPVAVAWKVKLAESVEAGMTPAELTQWRGNPLSAAVPAVAVEGSTLFANYLGYVFAVDMKSGKLLWRSAPFHHLEVAAMQDQARAIDASRFGIVASGEYVWDLGRDLKDPNFMAPFHLTCRRAAGGEVVWRSTDLPDYAQIEPLGRPLLFGGRLYLAAKGQGNPQQQGLPQQLVLAIQPLDGKLIWKTEVGTFKQGQQYFYYGYEAPHDPAPQLVHDAGAIYVDTHLGLLARLDADTGALDWGYGYPTEPANMGMGRFFFFNGYPQPAESTTASSPPARSGEALLIKGAQSSRLEAIDADRMKPLWDRPLAKSSRLLGIDGGVAILGGPELGAVDLGTRKLLWSARLPDGSAVGRVLVRPDGLWQLTPRGVFEVDPKTGAVRRIFRGDDLGSAGGDLLLTDALLLAVSNRTISAYPRRGAAGPAATTPPRASND